MVPWGRFWTYWDAWAQVLALIKSLLLMCTFGGSTWGFQQLGPCRPHEQPGVISQPPIASKVCFGHLRNEPPGGRVPRLSQMQLINESNANYRNLFNDRQVENSGCNFINNANVNLKKAGTAIWHQIGCKTKRDVRGSEGHYRVLCVDSHVIQKSYRVCSQPQSCKLCETKPARNERRKRQLHSNSQRPQCPFSTFEQINRKSTAKSFQSITPLTIGFDWHW